MLMLSGVTVTADATDSSSLQKNVPSDGRLSAVQLANESN